MVHNDEQLFERFRGGDVAALGEVFDRVAPALLRTAIHLTRDPAGAEDLLQSTFLRAIEVRNDWDGTRPLLPWLFGILHNLARHERARRERVPDRSRLAVPLPIDPAQAAEHAEFDAAVDAAIADLPEVYRPVLRMHLAYGHPPAEIAHTLDRPPGTVRSQLARGLELLRKLLPTGFAGAAALTLDTGRGLVGVKRVVLSHAAAAVAVVKVGTVIGGMVVMKKVMLAALVVAIGLMGWLGLESARGVPEPLPGPQRIQSPGVAVAVDGTTAVPSDEADLRRDALPRKAAPSDQVTVRGRLVAAWNGTPQMADLVQISVTAERSTEVEANRRGPVTLHDEPSAADGSFEASFAYRPQSSYQIYIRGSEFVTLSDGIPVQGPGLLELGDIRVQRGTRIGAHVVDEAGEPVPDVWFVIECSYATLGSTHAGMMTGIGTDAHGYLAMRNDARVVPGEVTLEAPKGYEILRTARFRIPDDVDVAEPTIVVRKLGTAASISGRVVDPRGIGIMNVRLLVRSTHRGFTGRDGTFRIFRSPQDGTHVDLSCVGSDTHLGVADQWVAWGKSDLVIVQPDARTLPLQVVAADTGAPITQYKVHFGASDDPMFGLFDLAKHWRTGIHADGRTELAGLPETGRLSLIVAPAGEGYEMSPQLNSDLPRPWNEPIVVRLLPRRPVTVHVITRDGSPVRGSQVTLAKLRDGEEMTDAALAVSRETAWQRLYPSTEGNGSGGFVIDSASTDDGGLARLRCAYPDGNLGIAVTGAGCRPYLASDVAFGAAPLQIVVEPGAAIRGRAVPVRMLPRFSRRATAPPADCLRVTLRRDKEADSFAPGNRAKGCPIGADGSFAFDSLEPGHWELVLEWNRPMQASGSQVLILEPPLAVFDLEAGADRDLGELDAEQFVPATIEGRVFHRGVPVADGLVTLTLHGPDASKREAIEADLGGVRTDADGRFELGGLLAGTYTVHVAQVAADGSELRLSSEDVIVARSARIERTFNFE